MKLFSFLYPKEEVTLQLHVNEELIETLPKPLVNEQPTENQKTESFTQGSYLTDSLQDLDHSSSINPRLLQ